MINNVPVKQRVEQFDAKHGASVYTDGWVWFEDGAKREGNPMGPLLEQPANPVQRRQNIVRYYEILLDRKMREFDKLKKLLTENPGLYPNQDENIQKLKILRCNARHYHRQLEAAQLDLRKARPGYVPPEQVAQRRRADVEHEAAKGQYRKRLDEINI